MSGFKMNLDEELKDLKKRLEKAWCRETSYYKKEWTPENPSCGQCMITTRYLVEHFNARAVFADAIFPDGKKASGGHYYTEIDGNPIDLTADQFPSGTKIEKVRYVTLSHLRADAGGRLRYNLLTQRLNDVTLNP